MLNDLAAMPNSSEVGLLATERRVNETEAFAKNMEAMGWKVIGAVTEREMVLPLLKGRHWGAVLLFDDLRFTSEDACVAQFREWEETERTDRQDNVYLVRGCGLYANESCDGDLPAGFDGKLDRQVLWEDLKCKLGSMKQASLMHDGGLNLSPAYRHTQRCKVLLSCGQSHFYVVLQL
jgi:hypothetical protein